MGTCFKSGRKKQQEEIQKMHHTSVWGWVDNDGIVISGWIYPLMHISTQTSPFDNIQSVVSGASLMAAVLR